MVRMVWADFWIIWMISKTGLTCPPVAGTAGCRDDAITCPAYDMAVPRVAGHGQEQKKRYHGLEGTKAIARGGNGRCNRRLCRNVLFQPGGFFWTGRLDVRLGSLGGRCRRLRANLARPGAQGANSSALWRVLPRRPPFLIGCRSRQLAPGPFWPGTAEAPSPTPELESRDPIKHPGFVSLQCQLLAQNTSDCWPGTVC